MPIIRPGLAGLFYKHLCQFINRLINSLTNLVILFLQIFKTPLFPNHMRDLKFEENVHLPPCVTCHMSHVMCHMSRVTGLVSHDTCRISHVTNDVLNFIFELVGGRSIINGAQTQCIFLGLLYKRRHIQFTR